jgi:hypothetical protein
VLTTVSPARTLAAPTPTVHVTLRVSPSTSPVALPDVTSHPPVGNLLTSASGVGSKPVELASLSSGSHNVTIRFACFGPTGAQVEDSSNSQLLGVSACDGSTLYATAFWSTADDHVLGVDVDIATSWVIAIWMS